MELKLRYVAKDDEGNISTKVFTIGEIEMGNPVYWLTSLPGKNVKLISRDMFTGKQDKNGKNIYAGDIIKTFPILATDKIGESYFNVEVVFKGSCWIANGILGDYQCQISEIIGNKWQNPELLND